MRYGTVRYGVEHPYPDGSCRLYLTLTHSARADKTQNSIVDRIIKPRCAQCMIVLDYKDVLSRLTPF